jgi:predicted transcriptional regulator/predicted HTH domain antitoxin
MVVAAGKILQALNPSKLGLLRVVYGDNIQTQKELSDAIGRSQATISTYLQRLETLSPPLIGKQGKYYAITNTGEKVISLINGMNRRKGPDLQTVDWTDETDRKAVDAFLTPLHDSQVMRPIFVLASLYARSDINGPLGTPQSVRFDDIVRDVGRRQDDIGENATTKQIRRTVKRRFNDTGTARFEEGQVTLTEKGHLHAWLLNELIQFLKKREEIDGDETEDTATADDKTTAEDLVDIDTNRTPPSGNSRRTNDQSGVPQRLVPEEGYDNSKPSEKRPTVIPVYSLRPTNTSDSDELDSFPLLPLTEMMTLEELTTRANQLANEYDDDAKLVLDWMIQTESGLYPLSSADHHTSKMLEPENG